MTDNKVVCISKAHRDDICKKKRKLKKFADMKQNFSLWWYFMFVYILHHFVIKQCYYTM
jgi:hypothetical protein